MYDETTTCVPLFIQDMEFHLTNIGTLIVFWCSYCSSSLYGNRGMAGGRKVDDSNITLTTPTSSLCVLLT